MSEQAGGPPGPQIPPINQQPLPQQPQLPPQAPSPEVVELRAQVSTLTMMVQQMMQMQAQQPAQQPQTQAVPQPPVPRPMDAFGFNDPEYYVRIKPFDPKKGHKRRRQYFDELSRPLNGGSGKPGDIPEWFLVDRDRAIQLSKYRQDPSNPASPGVLDIVTPQEKEQIDHAESQYRAAALGLMGMSPQGMQNAARDGQVNARLAGIQGAQPPHAPTQYVREQASILGGAQVYQQQPQAVAQQPAYTQPMQPQPLPQMQPVVHQQPLAAQPIQQAAQPIQQPQPIQPQQPQQPLPASMAGRAEALAGLPPPPPPLPQAPPPPPANVSDMTAPPEPAARPLPTPPAGGRGVSEDLTAEAAKDDGAKEAIEAAKPYMSRTD